MGIATGAREEWLATGVAGLALVSLLAQVRAGPTDGALRIATAYQEAVADIPTSALVQIVTLSPDPMGAAAERFIAQHVLAPRLVTERGNATTFALTPPGAPPDFDRDPRLAGFQLLRVTDTGVRLYQRRD